jgi:hypothetical protein
MFTSQGLVELVALRRVVPASTRTQRKPWAEDAHDSVA